MKIDLFTSPFVQHNRARPLPIPNCLLNYVLLSLQEVKGHALVNHAYLLFVSLHIVFGLDLDRRGRKLLVGVDGVGHRFVD